MGDVAIELIVAFLIICILGFVVYKDSTSDKLVLNKSEWVCTETENLSTSILVGKVFIPQITQRCIKYEKQGR